MRLATGKIHTFPDKCSGCLMCQMACSMTFTKRYNPAKAYILIEDGDDDISPFRISFTEECKDCGICVRYCSYGALKIKGEG